MIVTNAEFIGRWWSAARLCACKH